MNATLTLARDFLAEDPDPTTRGELEGLLARVATGDDVARRLVDDAFAGGLTFGTAGLRGVMGAGTNRMNRVVVMKASWGLGTYLLESGAAFDVNARERGVVIGFDGRRGSRRFAEDTAAVLCGLGIPVAVFADPVPTPVCAFAVSSLNAAAGVMVTASHNPPADNGYKVYWANGAQIIPPHDKGIAACIARAPRVPAMTRLGLPAAAATGLRRRVPDDVERAYLAGVKAASLHPGIGRTESLSLVYTAMHGVGHRFVLRALEDAGFERVFGVPEQSDADHTFHTVAFPNPEEPGALDLALAAAHEVDADLVLANDPDADRIAVCARARNGVGYTMLSGNEVGVLLCADALACANTGSQQKLVITTIVSSTWLSRIAADLGAAYAEVLTGFKWIANAAIAATEQGRSFVGGYEEALGVSVGPLVRDKDGVSAAVRVAELAAALRAEGKTLWDRLDELAVAHGLSRALQWSIVLPGSEGQTQIVSLMRALRESPPSALGGAEITQRIDLSASPAPGFEGSPLPNSDVLVFHDATGTRLTVRPSGTEPKIKMYLEAVARVGTVAELETVSRVLDEKLEAIRGELSHRLGLSP
ncbi:MAG: phospho-sugar mutase [Myxococcota bacterium]